MRNSKGQFIKGSNGRQGNIVPDVVKKKISDTLYGRYRGKDSPTWKGGRWIGEMGYIRIPTKPGSADYIYEHRLVMEKMLGRKLIGKERPHHINGIKSDNRPENLMLLPNEKAHRRFHKVWNKGKTAIAAVMLCLCFIKGVEAKEMDHTKAVIHHTASHDVSVDVIRKWHVEENKWDDVGYHFVIRQDGTVEEGRDINKIGAHAKGRNHYIGIALTGYEYFTHAQISALKNLLMELEVKHIERHHEECPGPGLDMEDIWISLSLWV